MNKRIISAILSLVMLLSVLLSNTAFASESNDFIIKGTDAKCYSGTQVTIEINLVNNPGFNALTLGFVYDTNYISVVDITNNVPTMNLSKGSSPTWDAENNYCEDGILATVTFDIIENTPAGEYPIQIVFLDASNDEFEALDASTVNSIITVEVIPVPATGITLNKTTVSLTAGESENLIATVSPSNSTDTVTWTSSDPSVATVDSNGNVIAVSKGSAVITATAGDKSVSCTVNVICAHSDVTNVSAVSSTCIEQGWSAYKQCNLCGQLLDVDGNEISEIPFCPLADHSGGTSDCSHKAVCDVCGNTYGDFGDHNYGSLISEIPAKCEVAGAKAHYECSICNKLFDESKQETTADALVIPALVHIPGDWQFDADNHWKDCVTVGCGIIIESTKASHTFEWKIDKAASEDETGLKHEECFVCGYAKDPVEIPKLDHIHTMTHHDAVTATCTESGNIEYWTCSSSKCSDVYYTNAEGTATVESIVTTDPDNHVGGTEIRNAVDATCHSEGYTGDIYCKGCGVKLSDGTAISKTNAHIPGDWQFDADNHWKNCVTVGCGVVIESTKAAHNGGESTCVKKAVCSVCGVAYGDINANNHKNTELRNAVAATEDNTGYTGDLWCNDCNVKITEGTVIPKLDHVHNMTENPAKAATCFAEGNIRYYTCSSDKCSGIYYADANGTEILSVVTIPMDADNHTETEIRNAKEATKTEEGYTGDKYCKGCNTLLEAGKVIPMLVEYSIIEGADQSVTAETVKDIVIKADGDFTKFTGLKIDGKELVKDKDYTVVAGSTVVTLKGDYVKSLGAGKHTVTFLYIDGEVSTDLTITQENAPATQTQSPQTGDNTHMALWILLMVVSSLGVITLTVVRRKQRSH